MSKLKCLDLFCGAGGASMGYHRAGFKVTGVDIAPQPNYLFKFIQADALGYVAKHGHEYDLITASPPCQDYSILSHFTNGEYPRLIASVRDLLIATGKPYIIENVEGARSELHNPITLCGSMFPERRVYRHRLFESSLDLTPPYVCDGNHNDSTPAASRGVSPKGYISVAGNGGSRGIPKGYTYMQYASMAMGINWASRHELSESFPPEYTHWLGCQVMMHLNHVPRSWPIVRALQEMML